MMNMKIIKSIINNIRKLNDLTKEVKTKSIRKESIQNEARENLYINNF